MSRHFEHRVSLPAPPEVAFAALVDRAFLDQRLRSIGGKNAEVVEHSVHGEEVSFRLRQGVDARHLPSAARSALGGDLVVGREERWRPDGAGYVASSRATISGVPGDIDATIRLAGRPGTSESELVTSARVRVGIPLIGGKLESVVVGELGKLLDAEAEFATGWLAALD